MTSKTNEMLSSEMGKWAKVKSLGMCRVVYLPMMIDGDEHRFALISEEGIILVAFPPDFDPEKLLMVNIVEIPLELTCLDGLKAKIILFSPHHVRPADPDIDCHIAAQGMIQVYQPKTVVISLN